MEEIMGLETGKVRGIQACACLDAFACMYKLLI